MVYVAAITSSKLGSQLGLANRLRAYGIGWSLRYGVTKAFFSGRMPMYHEYASEMTPMDYYDARVTLPNGKTVALDPQIRLYESWGARRVRLVENGFTADWESCGFAVLFILDIPLAGKNYSWVIGRLLQGAAKHPKLLEKLDRFL